MNTIGIRSRHYELIKRIRSNVRAYREFTQFAQYTTAEDKVGASMYKDSKISLKEDYLDFIRRCFREDIEELNQVLNDWEPVWEPVDE